MKLICSYAALGEPVDRHEVQGVTVDEVIVDDWLHLEHMDIDQYWMRLGDARILIRLTANGPIVDVERGTYADVQGSSTVYQKPVST